MPVQPAWEATFAVTARLRIGDVACVSEYASSGRRRRIEPFSMRFNQRDKFFVRVDLRDVVFDAFFPDVEIDFSRSAADVAEIGIGHFAGSVDDATHDGDLHALEMTGLLADALRRRLQIEECAATAWTRDEFGFRNSRPRALQDIEGQFRGANRIEFGFDADQIAVAVAQEAAREKGGLDQFGKKAVVAGDRTPGGVANPKRRPRLDFFERGRELPITPQGMMRFAHAAFL